MSTRHYAPPANPDWADAKALDLTGPCICRPAWTDRGLAQEDCFRCDDAGEIAGLLRQVARQAAEEMRERCVKVAANRAMVATALPASPKSYVMGQRDASAGIATAIRELPLEDDNG